MTKDPDIVETVIKALSPIKEKRLKDNEENFKDKIVVSNKVLKPIKNTMDDLEIDHELEEVINAKSKATNILKTHTNEYKSIKEKGSLININDKRSFLDKFNKSIKQSQNWGNNLNAVEATVNKVLKVPKGFISTHSESINKLSEKENNEKYRTVFIEVGSKIIDKDLSLFDKKKLKILSKIVAKDNI